MSNINMSNTVVSVYFIVHYLLIIIIFVIKSYMKIDLCLSRAVG